MICPVQLISEMSAFQGRVVRLMSGVDMMHYTEAAVERTMKIQEVILRAVAKKLTWCQAAEIIGISDRQMHGAPGSRPVFGCSLDANLG